MEPLIRKLKKLLAIRFAGAEIELHERTSARRIGGSLIWEGFDGMDQLDRQIQLRQAIDAGLDPEERRNVSLIMTLTPHEEAILAEH